LMHVRQRQTRHASNVTAQDVAWLPEAHPPKRRR
jgi:hypothetical protein